jgi:nicotinamide-nucleotide amidase
VSAGDLAAHVVALLRQRDQTLATAESLTGGLIGAALTGVPGASLVYRGGVISYATDLKVTLAGVPTTVLERVGPVAEQTAREMALGVAERCAAHWGLATTGVAGPGRQDGHPVGEVHVAVAEIGPGAVAARRHRLRGSRAEIRERTVELALRLLAEQLETTSA